MPCLSRDRKLKILIREANLAAQRSKGIAHVRARLWLDCTFQDFADLNLGTSAVLSSAHF